MALKQISSNKCFGGLQKVFEHDSVELNCKMKFAVYLPPKAETGKCPALYWLSGLTCTEQNFISKSGYHQAASEHGLVVIAPDTSPRGCNIKGEDESWDFGTGAGFYVDATEDPWKTNYRMYSYVTKELPQLINASFPVDPQRMSIFGHSMGGHGALICALKNPGKYKSVSAFAPICNPVLCPWGKKAFSGYLGTDLNKWKAYDATHLVKSYPGSQLDILIDQGKDDQFLSDGQLLPDNFIAACTEKKIPVVFRLQEARHPFCCSHTPPIPQELNLQDNSKQPYIAAPSSGGYIWRNLCPVPHPRMESSSFPVQPPSLALLPHRPVSGVRNVLESLQGTHIRFFKSSLSA
ncbi:S-formylglutathione hydrolase [Pteropus alecto]|uniref:S-formylglutathione hydrolase n=1 Tax=Pteropus alecto TaxID=9402 RepID=L5KDM5_PTEAL|nr:S-formylglutathione hydrolase [Pteropus alecto]